MKVLTHILFFILLSHQINGQVRVKAYRIYEPLRKVVELYISETKIKEEGHDVVVMVKVKSLYDHPVISQHEILGQIQKHIEYYAIDSLSIQMTATFSPGHLFTQGQVSYYFIINETVVVVLSESSVLIDGGSTLPIYQKHFYKELKEFMTTQAYHTQYHDYLASFWDVKFINDERSIDRNLPIDEIIFKFISRDLPYGLLEKE